MFRYQQNHQTPWNRHLVSSHNWIKNETDHLMQPASNYEPTSTLGSDSVVNHYSSQQDEDVYSSYTQEEMDSHINVELCDDELWKQFSNVGTEMILTKSGRRIFPGYRVQFSGLNPKDKYCVMIDVISMDSNRYKFQEGKWVPGGRGESHYSQNFFAHPTSPSSGEYLMKNITSFHKVKLTNALSGRKESGKFILHSMHRYQLRVHIVKSDNVQTANHQRMRTFQFPQTTFITVTAYQNSNLSQLKIANNPFARGFRPDGARGKNKLLQNHNEESQTLKKAKIIASEFSVNNSYTASMVYSYEPRLHDHGRDNRYSCINFPQYHLSYKLPHQLNYIPKQANQNINIQPYSAQPYTTYGFKPTSTDYRGLDSSYSHGIGYNCNEQFISPSSGYSSAPSNVIYQQLHACNSSVSPVGKYNAPTTTAPYCGEEVFNQSVSGTEILYPAKTEPLSTEFEKTQTFQTLESANLQNFEQQIESPSPSSEDTGYLSASPNEFLSSVDVSRFLFESAF